MSHDDDRDFRKVFDVRQVNLTKLDKPIDLEIIVAECENAVAGIKRQIADGYGDNNWLQDATRAMEEIRHKQGLAAKKLTAVLEAKANAPVISPENNYKSRFVKEAERLLPPAMYEGICAAARFKGEPA